jgi:hypothetical protein
MVPLNGVETCMIRQATAVETILAGAIVPQVMRAGATAAVVTAARVMEAETVLQATMEMVEDMEGVTVQEIVGVMAGMVEVMVEGKFRSYLFSAPNTRITNVIVYRIYLHRNNSIS